VCLEIEQYKIKMLKLLFFAFLLSVDAQKLKLNSVVNVREGIEISDVNEVQSYQNAVTYRLPNNTQPELYLINLNFGNFNEGDMRFTGNVFLTIRVMEDTRTITLHNSALVIDTSLATSEGVQIIHTVDYDAEREFMIISAVNDMLIKDSIVQLTVNYQGLIGTSVAGIYRGSYLHNDDETRS
jgi:hypothetical protein